MLRFAYARHAIFSSLIRLSLASLLSFHYFAFDAYFRYFAFCFRYLIYFFFHISLMIFFFAAAFLSSIDLRAASYAFAAYMLRFLPLRLRFLCHYGPR